MKKSQNCDVHNSDKDFDLSQYYDCCYDCDISKLSQN